ncbi:hypothetical protein [Granulicella sp. L60]|uniref:hypothetical protein n=1 Tax=Granulicella sp. L60 TaxID=1641866 RepID=UPI00131C7404|nr:hypothetical protein [Granulicella sp. L60]
MNIISHRFILKILGLAILMTPVVVEAEIHSTSKEIVVMDPHDLPEQAKLPGNSLFLHSDDAGSTYLFVEQQQGARLSVFDVTDPARIKMVSTTALNVSGAFDFIRPLDGRAELVRFRDGKGVAVLDLHKPSKPALHMVDALADLGLTQPLGESGFLAVNEPYDYVRATPRDFQVVDISIPSDPKLLATVKQVKHRVVNEDTGTTFLLGSDGLTVVRRLSVEYDYKVRQMQMQGN